MIKEGALIKIVGAKNVSSDQEKLEEHSRDMSFTNEVKPECIVKPRDTSDVEKIIKLANETLTPIVPISSGSPHFKGDTVPSSGGAMILDLSGMKKIVRVDRQNRVALVEPGVTFTDLIPAVEKEGIRLNMPLLPRKSKSVVGSMLEREPVMLPKYHWDIADPLACTEVIFGSGTMFRTGAAAGPGTLEEQWAAGAVQKEAAGPTQASLYRVVQGAQGTMGIVTWASLRCELLPKLEKPYLVGSSQIEKIFELVHWLIRLRLVNECFVLNNTNLAAIMAKKWPQDYKKIKDTLPQWGLFFVIAGYEYFPQEMVDYQIDEMADMAQKAGLEPAEAIGKVSAYEMLKLIKLPSEEPYWKLRYKGGCSDIFFLANYDRLPELIATMKAMADEAGYPASDIGIYLQPIVQGVNCHCEFNLFYDREDKVETARIKELTRRAVINLMCKGAFFSRPYGENTDVIMNRDAATVSALKKVKLIFDPNNIMNPGKLCF